MNAACLTEYCTFRHGGIIASVGLLFISGGGAVGHRINQCLFDNAITDCLFITDCDNAVVTYCRFQSLFGAVSDHIQFTGLVTGSGGSEVHHCFFFIDNDSGSAKGCVVQGQSVITPGLYVHHNVGVGGNYLSSFGGAALTGFDNARHEFNLHFNGVGGSQVGTFGMGGPGNNCVWRYNASLNCAFCAFNFFSSVAHTNIGVYYNTVYKAQNRAWSTGGGGVTVSGVVHGNILGAVGSSHRVRVDGGGITFSKNIVPGEQANFIFWGSTSYSTMAAFQAGSGQGANCTTADAMPRDVFSTPARRAGESFEDFYDRAWRQFELDASSTAIDAADIIAGAYVGHSGAAPDIGGREWQSQVLN
jgi:hypothetical protein